MPRPGEYGLVASRHEREGGVFRVNFRTGEMSICYVFEERAVYTPQTTRRSATPSAADPGRHADTRQPRHGSLASTPLTPSGDASASSR